MEWRRWHEEYDDPDSRLSRRLEVVRTRLAEILTAHPSEEVRLLSLCAGDARDAIPVLAAHPKGRRVHGLVVELDNVLALRAADSAKRAGLPRLEVRRADAGDIASFSDVLPVDVLLLCGIFGNIERNAVSNIVERIPSVVSEGGFVIWTRGGHDGDDDPRPHIRRCFTEAGMAEMSFNGPLEAYGVGVNRVSHSGGPLNESRLFDFIR